MGRAIEHHSAKTTSWTSDELGRIEAAEELEIAPRRRDGTLRKPVPIWVVRVGDDVHVRAAQVDAAYRAKYRRYAGGIVDGITNAQARSTTLRLAPRSQLNNLNTTGEPS